MNAESQICERVSRADAKTLTLDGAPRPYLEFKDSMTVGDIAVYELIYSTRSLIPVVIEIGVAAYAVDNKLVRLAVIRSIEKKRPIRIHDPSHGVFFVRVVSDATLRLRNPM